MSFLPERERYSAHNANLVIFAELAKLQENYNPQIVLVLSNISAKHP